MKQEYTVDIYVPSTAEEEFLSLKNISSSLNVFPVNKTISGLIYSTLKYVPSPIKGISLRDLEKTQKKIAETINKIDYDIVFSEQDQYTMTPFFLKYIKKPTIYYCPQPPRNEVILRKISNYKENSKPIKNIILKYIDLIDLRTDKNNISFAKNVLTNSYFSRESILRFYGINSFVSYLGVDTNLFMPLKIPKKNFVLSVGTCTPSKGYDFIIKSLALIEPEIRPDFIIVSNHTEVKWENYIKILAEKLNVNLQILDMISDDKLVTLYNEAKLVVYAPYLEPFGLVPLESMACGTPVVGVKEGGIRETVLHNKTGLHSERDENIFASAILELLLDENKRKLMAQNSLKRVKEYWTLENAGQRLVKHIERII
ncbi:glycosyltransferase family 4 protein [Methanobacterium sp.]|uniref:glycosyltransferase family 4 protein n=1 Tax=Methanobacterium sp. TaxID=2164 RepID=UPI003D65D3F3